MVGSRLRAHHCDNGVDQEARREVLASAGLGILRVLFEQAFVDVAFDVGSERAPRFLVDEIDDETAEVRWVLDLVLSLGEDDADHARLLAEVFERTAIMPFERQSVGIQEIGPIVFSGDGGFLVVRRAGALVVHLEE